MGARGRASGGGLGTGVEGVIAGGTFIAHAVGYSFVVSVGHGSVPIIGNRSHIAMRSMWSIPGGSACVGGGRAWDKIPFIFSLLRKGIWSSSSAFGLFLGSFKSRVATDRVRTGHPSYCGLESCGWVLVVAEAVSSWDT
jgi:hypothetical protein